MMTHRLLANLRVFFVFCSYPVSQWCCINRAGAIFCHSGRTLMSAVSMDSPATDSRSKWASRYHHCVTHRWVRLVIFGIAVSFTSCLYSGWQQYSLLLLRGDKYGWLCESAEAEYNSDNGFVSCVAQEQAIARLFPVAAAMELLGSIFAGFALDSTGPRITAFFGEVLGLGAIVMIMFSNSRLNLLPASMVVTGVAINLVAFPALILEDWFPTAAATTAAYVVACQCISCIVAPVMWEIWKFFPAWTFNQIWTVYLGAIWIPASLLYIIALPKKREIPSLEIPAPTEDPEAIDIIEPHPSAEKVPFLRAFFTVDYAIMNVVNAILMLQATYYQVMVRPIAGQRISDFVGWGLPTQAIWGVMLGRIVDYIKSPAMGAILFLGYAGTYVMMQFPKAWLQYGAAVFFVVCTSYSYTFKYSYLQERYPAYLYGRLLGLAGVLGGCSVLLTNLLVGTLTPIFWCNFLAATSLVGILLSSYLSLSMKRPSAAAPPVSQTRKDSALCS
eukprot:Protomagalhaensia_wolfi_Nauph_80__5732@NODE_690_length_2108_cov_8_142581_g515_i0_p1_GENE_NODE_690_length_2108_cov_8_142581_g515_i0NODE_690_length_2108_cov_8_142581_g515_i0_p1_ORF_typecomplete_len501_score72_80MFS_1/PF07690_16/4_4e02MFS_1/PF07690_16/1_1e05MFS_1/PF07690_16/0_022MFS_3/PF05977_13/3_3e03MFS_3/PF05977_13/3_7e02MFS_3/PF05977_13/0_00037DUF4512/PF14975_6/2_2_NODE_690_length_2108_cov_8_142581_g515_i01221624